MLEEGVKMDKGIFISRKVLIGIVIAAAAAAVAIILVVLSPDDGTDIGGGGGQHTAITVNYPGVI